MGGEEESQWYVDLFRKKSLRAVLANLRNNKLHQTLTVTSLVSLGIGSVVGAGIFVITGQAAAKYAGPALSLSFCVSAVACFFTGLCYAELAAALPIAGSAYSYIYVALGEFVAWIVAISLTLEYIVSAAAVSVGWSASIQDFLREMNIHIPAAVGRSPFEVDEHGSLQSTGAIINLPAVFIIVLLSSILSVGVKESTRFNNGAVAVKLAVLITFVGYGVYFSYAREDEFQDNITPFIPPNEGSFGKFGLSGIFRGAGAIFFAYVGFDSVCSVAQECRNAERDLPRGLLIVLVVCTLLYIAVTVALTGMTNYTLLDVEDPVIFALAHCGAPSFFRIVVEIGTIAGLTSVCLVSLMSMPRLVFQLSLDGLLPPQLHHIHEKYKTPSTATFYCCIFCCLLCGTLPLDFLGEIVSFGTLVAFSFVCIGVIALRKMAPDHPRPFAVPYVPIIPILGVVSCLIQLFSLPPHTWRNYMLWLFLGLAVYMLYGRHHSKIGRNPNPGLEGDEIEMIDEIIDPDELAKRVAAMEPEEGRSVVVEDELPKESRE